MKLVLLTILALPLAAQVEIHYDQTVPSIEKTLAKRLPRDMHGMMAVACNAPTAAAPALFNPEWFMFYAHGHVRPQPGSAAIIAALDARNGSWQAQTFRATILAGSVFTGFSAGGLIEAGGQLAKYGIAAIPVLGPIVKSGLGKAVTVTKPEGWVEFDRVEPFLLPPGQCTAGAFAVAQGGESSFTIVVGAQALIPGVLTPTGTQLGHPERLEFFEIPPCQPFGTTQYLCVATAPSAPVTISQTHPQVDQAMGLNLATELSGCDCSGPDDRALLVAQMIRENTARMGAVE